MKKNNSRLLYDYVSSKFGAYHYAIYNLNTDKVIGYKMDQRVHSASIIKLYYLYAALRLVDDDKLSLNQNYTLVEDEIVGGCGILKLLSPGKNFSLKELLYLMIDVSDNTATNMLFDIIGKERLNSIIQNLGANNTCAPRKLMRVIPGIYSYTTVEDTILVLKNLVIAATLSPPLIELSLDILSKQQINDLLSRDWNICKNCGERISTIHCSKCNASTDNGSVVCAEFYHKTGEIEGILHDAGMIEIAHTKYIIVLFSSDLVDNNSTKIHFNNIGHYIYDLLQKGELI